MKGILAGNRRGVHTASPNQYVVEIDGVADRASANGVIGKKVFKIRGTIPAGNYMQVVAVGQRCTVHFP